MKQLRNVGPISFLAQFAERIKRGDMVLFNTLIQPVEAVEIEGDQVTIKFENGERTLGRYENMFVWNQGFEDV